MSYGWFGDSDGTRASRAGSSRPAGSAVSTRGAVVEVVARQVAEQQPQQRQAVLVGRHREVGGAALHVVRHRTTPSSSFVTSSWVTVRMTSGPVTNMQLVRSTITVKSVMAGE